MAHAVGQDSHARSVEFLQRHSASRGRHEKRLEGARLAHLPPEATGIKARRSLTVGEANRFVDAVRDTKDEALVLLALTMGLRPGEVTGLSWEAVDLDEGVLTVRQALKRLPDGTYVIGAPKLDSYRMLRLPTELVGLLRAHRLTQRKARLSAEVWEDHGLVFTNALGRPIDASNLRRTVATYAKKANVTSLPQRAPPFGGLAARRQRHTAPGRLRLARSSRHSDVGPDLPAQGPLGRRRHEESGANAPRVSMLAPRVPKRLPCANSGGGTQ
jgi:integrase